MKLRHFPVVALLALVSACGGDDPMPPVQTVASVTVSPEGPTLRVGETQQMSALARDQDGQSVQGTVSWSSSATSVATVGATGVVTAVAPGTSAVTATVGGVAGSQVVTVIPNECDDQTAVLLAAGEHEVYPSTACLVLPGGIQNAYHRVAVVRPSQTESSNNVSDVTVTATALSGSQQLASARAAPARETEALPRLTGRLDGSRFVEHRAMKAATARFHMRMLEREMRERGPGPDGVLPNKKVLGPRLMADPPARLDLTAEFSCSASPRAQTLVNFNDDLAIYQDSIQRASTPITVSQTQEVLDYYTAYVKDMIPQYWGDVSDVDGNGRIIVTTAPSMADSIAASVFTGDLRTDGSCAASNEAEVVFMNVTLFTDITTGDYLALPTIAHEVKHLVSIYNRYQVGHGIPPLWIEEGLAEISAEMSSRIAWAATGGPAVGEEVTGTNIIATVCATDPCGFTKEIYGLIDLLANSIVQLSTFPNSLVTNPEGASPYHSIYASGWHYHRFLGDAFGNASTAYADGAFYQSLVSQNAPFGFAATQAATGRTFDQLFEDLIVAMSLHGSPGPQPTRSFATWDFFTASQIFASPEVLTPPGFYPWPQTWEETGTDGNGNTTYSIGAPYESDSWTASAGLSGITFFDFVSDGAATELQLEVAVTAPAQIIVTRIR